MHTLPSPGDQNETAFVIVVRLTLIYDVCFDLMNLFASHILGYNISCAYCK